MCININCYFWLGKYTVLPKQGHDVRGPIHQARALHGRGAARTT